MIAVTYQTDQLLAPAQAIAQQWQLPLCDRRSGDNNRALLTLTSRGLLLSAPAAPELGGMRLDFASPAMRQRCQGAIYQLPLLRAIGRRNNAQLKVIDLSAGLGRDAFVMAHAGLQVTMLERSAAACALLSEALARVGTPAGLQLVCVQAVDYLRQLPPGRVDVIYFDPMYPTRSKSALPKKELRLWRILVGDDQDAAATLQAALSKAKRVVVKRPRLAAVLGDVTPSYQQRGASTRYDIYLNH